MRLDKKIHMTTQQEAIPSIITKLQEELDKDTATHSLHYIQLYISSALERQGINPHSVRIQILPPISKNNTWFQYLSISITSPFYPSEEHLLSTKSQLQALKTLMNIVNNFERDVQKEVRQLFAKMIKEKEDTSPADAENDIRSSLEKNRSVFLQHGLDLRGVKIEKNKDGEFEIHIFMRNIMDDTDMTIRVPTNIFEPSWNKVINMLT